LSKRRSKKRRKAPREQEAPQGHQPPVALQEALERAKRLIDRGQAQEAIDLLEPLLASRPRVPDLHYVIGYARIEIGDPWGGLAGYEQAMELSRDPAYWLALASLYLHLELNAYALQAFRQVLKHQPDAPRIDNVRETVTSLEQDIAVVAEHLDRPVEQVERGLRYLEDGQRAMQRNDFRACIAANRRAIMLLGDWPPPHNNLSMALFFDGKPDKAIATARQVLAQAPENLQALSNSIRFLAWTGQDADARALWVRLKDITPQDRTERLKVAEAAAVLGEDEHVYQSLKPLDTPGGAREEGPRDSQRVQLYLAVAEANTGRRAARRRLRALQKVTPWAGDLLAALEAGQPGPGWAERFPYFHSAELMPRSRTDEFIELLSREDEMPPQKFRSQVAHFAARFPQVIRMADKLIWEEAQPAAGIAILATIGTPAAYAALRRFGLSQASEDEVRMEALVKLLRAGEITQDETLRVWHSGEWREVQLRGYEISDERERPYSEEVADLLNRGVSASQQNNPDQAERLFRRALKLEPRAKEAYNNLGAIYARRGEHERAKEMFRAALEIDPNYVFPRCNLATYLLDDGDVKGAEDMLKPLADRPHFLPQEMAFYSYTQARILLRQGRDDEARNALETALAVWPGYEPAEQLLARLDMIIRAKAGLESYEEQQHKRDRAKRARLQTKLSTPDPPLPEALSNYTKDALTGMGNVVLPWGQWSGLRKAELLEQIVAGLTDPDNLDRIISDLTDEEQAALRQVVASSGHMAWQDFDADYGNDLEESAYWNWHEPETTMGRLRLRGLLVETTVDGELLIAVPQELRQLLGDILS
jgi:tetratricopeptide (TPR) repeat protein